MSTTEFLKNSVALMRQEFDATEELERRGETAASAIAAQAQAAVQARYVMAMKNPRNWLQVRENLTQECKRPEFANNKSAIYRKPIGEGIEGLGIRFVEVALRCMTNILVESPTVYEDGNTRIVRVQVTDLESNLTHFKDVVVNKTVERRYAEDGTYLSVRKNSKGDFVYTIPATDDDLLNKENALTSKALRTQGLRLIPGDLQDECTRIIREVRKDKAAKDPKAEAKSIADAFARLNVRVGDLEQYLEHALDQCTPEELVDLRGIYGALADGETTWKSVLENGYTGTVSESVAEKPKRGVEAVKEKVRERKAVEAVEPQAGPKKRAERVSAAKEKVDEQLQDEPKTDVKIESKVGATSKAIEPEEEEELPKPAVSEDYDDAGKRLFEKSKSIIRKITFPKRLTRRPGDSAVNEELIAEIRLEAERLEQDMELIAEHWLNVKFADLNTETVRALIAALRNVPSTRKVQ